MKFLHMADLHIGITVNGFSMLDDQLYMLKQIISYIKAEQPDVVLIAGDIYDQPNPGTSAINIFDDFLSAMADLAIPLLIINGNHDSPERLAFAAHILAQRQIFVYSVFDGTLHQHTFTDQYGEVHFYMMPFIRPANVRHFFDEHSAPDYQAGIQTVIQAAGIDLQERNVLMAHQIFISENVNILRSASEIEPAGGLDGIEVEVISGFDYAALGHLHEPQTVGHEHIRYSGSILKYSSSEYNQQKTVAMVELGPKGELNIKLLPLIPLRDMRAVEDSLEALLKAESAAQDHRDDYLLVTLTNEESNHDVLGEIRNTYPNVMALTFVGENKPFPSDLQETAGIADKNPWQLFAEFFAEQNDSVLNPEQIKIVQTLSERTEP